MALQECGLNMNSTQKELRPHGTMEFPCAGYESEHTPAPDDVIPWHWHEEFEAIFIPEGTLSLKVLSEAFRVHQGELAFINSGALHYGDTDNYCHLQSIVFSPLLITGTSDSDFAANYVTPLKECCDFSCMIFPSSDSLTAKFQNAFEALRNDSFAFEFAVREMLSNMILAAYKKYEPSIAKPERGKNLDSIRLAQMLGFIENHYPENITLADLCNAAYIGERETMRCFKRTVGESPMQYLMKFRLMKSANMLLENPSLSIAEIAGMCGFDSPSYYTKKFKELYKCTPRDYVKQHKHK
jgi:AraC-like DNA-binding protein